MNTRIRNAIETIGTPLMVLLLVFSLATPVSAIGAVSIVDSGIDANGQYVILENGDTASHTVDSITVDGTSTTVTTSIDIAAGDTAKVYLGSGTDDATAGVYYLGLADSAYDRHEEDMTITLADGSSSSNTVLWWADAGTDQTVTAGDTVSVSAYDAYTGVTITGYSWDFDGDGVEDATGATATYSYATAGTYTVDLTVTSDRTGSQTDSMTVTVEEANTAPVADAGADQSAVVGDTVSFDGSASSDADGDALTYSWDFDGDGVEDATGATPTYSYAAAGSYTVTLTVSDGTATATDSMTVTVGEANNPPVIDSGLDPATNITATVNESVSFDASNSTDADGDSLTYSWDFDGDGTTDSTNATATYTYDTAGTYNASLTVSDGTDSVSETYTVVVEESTDDGTTTTTEEPTTEEPVGGGSGSDGLSTESILAIIGSFLFLVAVGVAVKRIA
ncbi:PKD domain-containing protein [Halobellus litoreus]|uniref:PKD domain-containing protein n=1 Tax=Halobellus litoreus TaxID=755310 RepID=A0ABD6DW22_9EURY|nr:PKD domain-containing protein [Halobellus litoreus]